MNNAKQRIESALETIMPSDKARACRVWKGYDAGTGRTGWHYTPFGETARYLGATLDEALETIEDKAEELRYNAAHQ